MLLLLVSQALAGTLAILELDGRGATAAQATAATDALRDACFLEAGLDVLSGSDIADRIAALLPAGGDAEVEIRAATVQAVEALRAAVQRERPSCQPPLAIHLDWRLWALGESARDTLPPHHRTCTIFY